MEQYSWAACRIVEDLAAIPCEEARRLYLETGGRHFRAQLAAMGVNGALREEAARRFEEAKLPILEAARPGPLVVERVEKLRRAGLLVAVSTNNECSLVGRLGWLRDLVDLVLCHDPDKGLEKGLPHLRVLESLGYRPCEIVFIGDSDYDLEVYRPLGVRVVRSRGLWDPRDSAVEAVLEMIDHGA